MESNSVCNHTRDKQIGRPLRGRPILLSLGTLHIFNLRMRSFRTPYFKVQRHFEVILYEFWHELVRDTARHC